MEKIEKKMERMEIKMDLILDMLREVAQPKYYYASDKAQPLNEQPEEEYHYLNGNEPIKDKETIEFIEGLPERVWEDTPEETEECLFVPNPKYRHHHFENELLEKVLEDITEEWRERFEQDFAILLREDFKMYARPIDNPQNAEGEYPDIGKDLVDFISEELSKAREEGRREGVYNTLLEINRIKSLKVGDYIIEPKTEMPIKITKIQDGELFYYGYDDEDNDYTAGYSATPEDLVDWGYKAKLNK